MKMKIDSTEKYRTMKYTLIVYLTIHQDACVSVDYLFHMVLKIVKLIH